MIALLFGCVLSIFDLAPAGITQAHLHTVAEFALVILLFLGDCIFDYENLGAARTL